MPDQPTQPGAPGPADPLAPETLKSALKAFRKRLKLTRLDDESRLGGGRPTTGGRKSQIMAIIPPNQFRAETWQELARQGKLKNTGGGFYELVGE